jgi:hypothetical protein
MNDTLTPASPARKARRRVATAPAERRDAALPVRAGLIAEPAASGDVASFWAAPWR